jgi:hypothetical protein
MLNTKLRVILLTLVISAGAVRAAVPAPTPDEGMWLVSVITKMNIDEMRKIGFELSAEDIYSLNTPSLKDAVMVFGGFCTGEFVSAKGLVFTNHHCGYDAIAGVSTPEENHLDDGFWASSYEEEIPIEGLYIELLVKADNITDSILPAVADMDDSERSGAIRAIIGRIEDREAENTGLKVQIKSMYNGNQYFIFYRKRYTDVRLVGTPPQSIGKYGGDTDNWMWPRHTGDFSIFRVYADANNEPADYSESNVPYKPMRHLKIDLNGISEGDPAMIMGFPGSTDRYLTSYAMKEVIEQTNPAQIDMFRSVTTAMKKEMDKDDAVRLTLAPDYASFMNVLKLYTGQIEGMTRVMDAVAVKEAEEKKFATWLDKQDGATQEKYGSLMNDYAEAYKGLSEINYPFYYKRYAAILPSYGGLALALEQLEAILSDKEASDDEIEAIKASIMEEADASYPTMYGNIERDVIVSMLLVMHENLPAEQQPTALKAILSSAAGSTPEEKIRIWATAAIENSVFGTREQLEAFLAKPKLKTLQKDELYRYFTGINEEGLSLLPEFRQHRSAISSLNRIYTEATMQMYADKPFYPDANFSMRLTYGKIWDYSPKDAVNYHWQTYLEGVMEKMDNNDEEFMVPDELFRLYNANDLGRYADETGDVPVCFLSDNDITGGNSGSPVMNKRGDLIGIAFDGNYEGTPGDYVFDPEMNRTISVDIRYVLFIIDKFARSAHIMSELDIVE